MTPLSPSPLRAAVRSGLAAARANLLPGLVLQALALAVVLSYALWPAAAQALNALADYRSRSGLLFGMISTSVCGGIIPWLYMSAVQGRDKLTDPAKGLLTSVFWAYKGIEVEMLYRFLAHLLGDKPTPAAITGKVLFDQFVYCPILAIPVTVVVYSWAEHGYSLRKLARDLRTEGWYLRRVLTPLVANMGIWLPSAILIYSLPTALQLPMQNLVLVFFTLLLARLARHEKNDTTEVGS